MGGFFGVASKEACNLDLFYGTDYHSHLGREQFIILKIRRSVQNLKKMLIQ